MTITIIAVMAALLSPALKSAKDRAKLAQCIYNLHNIGLGNQLYVSDNRGFAYFWEQNGGGAGAWFDGHVRLFKNGEIQRRNFAGTWQTYYYNYAYP